MRKDFPNPVSYTRFVERQAQVVLYLLLFLQTCALSKCTGISIIDSTPIVSCHIKREKQHKTMKGWAANELKNICQIEHTKHHSVDNFAINLFAGLIAYNLLPQKPSMNIEIIDNS